jgi:hypothetical protein
LDADEEEEEEKTSPIFKSKRQKEKLMYKLLLLDPIEAL